MAKCPDCGKPGAYVGFNSIECENPNCEHYLPIERRVCACCGKLGHYSCTSTPKDAEPEIKVSESSGDCDSSEGCCGRDECPT